MRVERLLASGAMYAGVPTVDLGCESNTADCGQGRRRGAGAVLSQTGSTCPHSPKLATGHARHAMPCCPRLLPHESTSPHHAAVTCSASLQPTSAPPACTTSLHHPRPHTLLYPKSQILSRGAGRPSSSVFSSFRSRWHTPCTPAAASSSARDPLARPKCRLCPAGIERDSKEGSRLPQGSHPPPPAPLCGTRPPPK